MIRRPYLLIALVVAAVHARVLGFGFTYLDDNALILDNARFLGEWASLWKAFTQDVFHQQQGAGAFYRPWLMVSLILDAKVWGLSEAGFHFTNILIHLAASCLVLRLIEELGEGERPALLAALFFAVHPALAAAAAWVPARNDSLQGLFVFASFIGLVRFARDGSRRDLAWHLGLLFCAVLTKETAVALVPAAALYLWLEGKARERGAILAAGWAASLLVWAAMRSAAIDDPLTLSAGSMLRSVWVNLPGLLVYLGKAILPLNPSVIATLRDSSLTYGLLAGAGLAAALLLSEGVRARRAAFALGWFVLFLLPTFILHDTTTADFLLEHRLYVPMLGVLLLLLELIRGKPASLLEGKGAAAAAVVLAAYAGLAVARSGAFRDPLSFWGNAVTTSPHLPLAHRNLGAMLYLQGLSAPAEAAARRALELNPAEPMAHNNLGLIYMRGRRWDLALEEFLKELAINPEYDAALYNLGLLYRGLGKAKEAEAYWGRSVRANPLHGDAQTALYLLYAERGDKAALTVQAEAMRKFGLPLPSR